MKDSFSVSPAQVTIVVVCVVCIYFVIGFYGKSLESYRIDQRADQVRREVAQLETENKALQTTLADLSTDGFIETEARDKLNLARPGDHTLIVLPEKPEVAWVESLPNATSQTTTLPHMGHIGDWLAAFFG